ncbi:MAG TPA: DeoR/GlpR family DNA-binding transcription regulator [Clostridia bacterium]|nr:DeoR/GlpR family DNA-binding transcription regulator [Clostridia bacterium]
MFAAQRMKTIQDFLIKNKSADITTLSNLLDVSDVTVRKDLEKLEEEGFLIKNHGGAVLVEGSIPDDSGLSIENYSEKEQIADLANTLIEDGDIIFLGPGSTCYLFSKKLKGKNNITVVTNNINAINELYSNVKEIISLGGEIANNNGMLYTTGYFASEYLKGIYVNKAILGVNGVDFKTGFTVNDMSLCNLLKKVPTLSRQIYYLADHTKFDRIGFYQIGPIDSPDCVVSNERLSDAYKQYFYEKDIKILTTFKD